MHYLIGDFSQTPSSVSLVTNQLNCAIVPKISTSVVGLLTHARIVTDTLSKIIATETPWIDLIELVHDRLVEQLALIGPSLFVGL
jgi:malonyl CoA-acyl carrier protein transacylase